MVNRKFTKLCCIRSCGSRSPDPGPNKRTIFRFPQNLETQKLWMETITPFIRKGRANRKNLYICELHFKDDDILRDFIIIDGGIRRIPRMTIRLKSSSVPSIFPAMENTVIENNDFMELRCELICEALEGESSKAHALEAPRNVQVGNTSVRSMKNNVIRSLKELEDIVREELIIVKMEDDDTGNMVDEKTLTVVGDEDKQMQKSITQLTEEQNIQIDNTSVGCVKKDANRNLEELEDIVQEELIVVKMEDDETEHIVDETALTDVGVEDEHMHKTVAQLTEQHNRLTLEDISNSIESGRISWPKTWSWCRSDDGIFFSQTDPFDLHRRLIIRLDNDLSFSIRTWNDHYIPTSQNVTCQEDIEEYLKSFLAIPTCTGTRFTRKSRAQNCIGIIGLNEEHRQHIKRPICAPCRTLRKRLYEKSFDGTNLKKLKYFKGQCK